MIIGISLELDCLVDQMIVSAGVKVPGNPSEAKYGYDFIGLWKNVQLKHVIEIEILIRTLIFIILNMTSIIFMLNSRLKRTI